MSQQAKFEFASQVAVVGATGGIGSEFVRQFAALDHVDRVFALSRQSDAFDTTKVSSLHLDFDDESSIASAARSIEGSTTLDAVIVATGLLHDAEIYPEKRLQDIDATAMLSAFRVNTIGPSLVAKHFLPLMRRAGKSVFAALSARVGSISDNRLGGWASYRASKAALNMLLRTAAIEHRRHYPESIVIALHPGTVDTRLSAPFQKRVPPEKLFAPEYAVTRLLNVIDELGPDDSGSFFAWDGQRIDF